MLQKFHKMSPNYWVQIYNKDITMSFAFKGLSLAFESVICLVLNFKDINK